jgi:hypothetical protein
MKFIISVFLIALTGFALGLYLPWWSVAVAGFLVSVFLFQKPLLSFAAGFLGIFLLWGIITFIRSTSNDHILAHRVALLILKKDSPYLLMAVSALIGGLVAGMGALNGSLLRKISLKS